MTGKYYVSGAHLPPRLPLFGPLVIWLYLDRYQAPGWLIGVFGAVTGIYCTLMIVAFIITVKTRDGAEPLWKEKT